MCSERLFDIIPFCIKLFFYKNHYIFTFQQILSFTKTLPNKPLNTIAFDRAWYVLFWYCQTKPSYTFVVVDCQKQKKLVARTIPWQKNSGEISRTPEFIRKPKTLRQWSCRHRSNYYYAARRFLPFFRLACIICLPARVCMRARKPWFLLRLSLLGWYVCFMSKNPIYCSAFKGALMLLLQ